MKKYFWIFIITMLVSVGCGKKEVPTETIAELATNPVIVASVIGTAQYQHTKQGVLETLEAGQILIEEDIVITGTDSHVIISLEKGKEVTVGAETIFALSAIRRDSEGNINIMALKQGSVVNNVETKLSKGDVYEVHTPRLVMSVRGTSNYMETGTDGDKIIGIAGETHAFIGEDCINVLQGMMTTQNPDGEVALLPSHNEDLPFMAKAFVEAKGITYKAITHQEIENAQAEASNNPKPYSNENSTFTEKFLTPDDNAVPQAKSNNSTYDTDISNDNNSDANSIDAHSTDANSNNTNSDITGSKNVDSHSTDSSNDTLGNVSSDDSNSPNGNDTKKANTQSKSESQESTQDNKNQAKTDSKESSQNAKQDTNLPKSAPEPKNESKGNNDSSESKTGRSNDSKNSDSKIGKGNQRNNNLKSKDKKKKYSSKSNLSNTRKNNNSKSNPNNKKK